MLVKIIKPFWSGVKQGYLDNRYDPENKAHQKKFRLLRKLAAIALSIMLLWEASWHLYYQSTMKRILPAEIELGWWFWQDGRRGWMSSCGMFVYGLSNNTAEAIKREGIDFFTDIKSSRTGKFRYGSWHATKPSDSKLFPEGPARGIKCAQRHSFYFPMMYDIRHALKGLWGSSTKEPEYYFTYAGGGTLIFFPALGYVVYIYS